FVAYAAAVIWHHGSHKSTFRVEQVGGLLFAASYIFYGVPFGSIDSGLQNFIRQTVSTTAASEEPDADLFLSAAAHRQIQTGKPLPTALDGSGLGYSVFATAALSLFGAHTLSLVLAFMLFLALSVLVFLFRFSDEQLIAIVIVCMALTLMLVCPLGGDHRWLDQSPIGGFRFFVIAGIIPTIHIIFELFERTTGRHNAVLGALLLGVQVILVVGVISVRLGAAYFVGAIACAAAISIWQRHDVSAIRSSAIGKISIILVVRSANYLDWHAT